MSGCYLSIDFEDWSHDLKRRLGVANPGTRSGALWKAYDGIMAVIARSAGSPRMTFFVTGQVARDHPDLIARIAGDGHEVGCHGFYHDPIWSLGRSAFADTLDRAIDVISQASGQPVRGFRAPSFSMRPNDQWAYEELARRFLYDSSLVCETRGDPSRKTDVITYGDHSLQEFPLYRRRLGPRLAARVIGGTYLKVLPVGPALKLLREAAAKSFVPVIYLHPYEFLHDGEFWVGARELAGLSPMQRAYWQIRQHQWLTVGNRAIKEKLSTILREFPNAGTMASALDA
jgi:hypothetical protein